jgi:hypothetical protein
MQRRENMAINGLQQDKVIENILKKSPTGIRGLDEIMGGGLPQERTTLVCGGPGCGKTLMATEFLVHGAQGFGEPGVFIARGDQILAIPTLIRKLPEPIKKIIGDLSNTERVMVGLDLRPVGGKPTKHPIESAKTKEGANG